MNANIVYGIVLMCYARCCAYVLLRLCENIFTFIWWLLNLCLHLNIIN